MYVYRNHHIYSYNDVDMATPAKKVYIFIDKHVKSAKKGMCCVVYK